MTLPTTVTDTTVPAKIVDAFGREELIAAICADLINEKRARVLIQGPTGIGKTHIAEAVYKSPKLQSSVGAICLYRVESPVIPVLDFVESITKQLIAQGVFDRTKLDVLIKHAKEEPVAIAKKLFGAFIRDLVQEQFPDLMETIDELREAADEVNNTLSTTSKVRQLANATSDDLVVAFLRLLKTIASLKVDVAIIVDGMEQSSTELAQLISVMVGSLPKSWPMLLTVNDETEAGLAALGRCSPPVATAGGEITLIRGIDDQAIRAWYFHERNVEPEGVDVQTVLKATEGRPYFVKEWIDGTPINEVSLGLAKAISPHYRRRVNELPDNNKELLFALAQIPDNVGVNGAYCAEIVKQYSSSTPVAAILSTLESEAFLTQREGRYYFVHEEAKRQVKNIGQGSADHSAGLALKATESAPITNDRVANRYLEFLIRTALPDQTVDLRSVATLAHDVRLSGRANAAVQILQSIVVRVDASAPRNSEDTLLVTTELARSLNQVGRYQEALGALRITSSDPQAILENIDALIVRLESQVRLNRYDGARETAAETLELLTKHPDLPRKARVVRLLNTIDRDIGRYDAAIKSAEALVAECEAEAVDDHTLSGCYETLARSLAFAKNLDRGIEYAQKALEIAEFNQNRRGVGNAHLALAEVYRHCGDQALALVHYRSAVEEAHKLNNVDALLWSTLGQADSFALSGKLDSADSTLKEIDSYIARGEQNHPLEYVHWRFTRSTLAWSLNGERPADMDEILEKYRILGIGWPIEYVQEVENGRLPGPKSY